MKTLVLIPLLALFGVPLASEDAAWHSNRYRSEARTVVASSVDRNVPITVRPRHAILEHERTRLPSAPRNLATEPQETETPVPKAPSSARPALDTLPTSTQAEPAYSSSLSPGTTTPVAEEDFAMIVEREAFRLTNEERAKNGAKPLIADEKLSRIAREHSADMVTRDFFDHVNPDGCSAACRATDDAYAWRNIGENIYMMSGYSLSAEDSARRVVQGWMNSPGHRANLLDIDYTHGGIGVWSDGESVYATGMYSLPR